MAGKVLSPVKKIVRGRAVSGLRVFARNGCPRDQAQTLSERVVCSLSRCRLDRVAEKHLPKPLPPALEPIGFAPVADRLPFPRFSPRKPKHMLLQIQDS